MNKIRTAVISGSNSKILAEKIANNLNLNLLIPRIVHFINSEMKIALPLEIDSFEQFIIVQSTSNPANDNLIELCLLADTLKREGAKHVKALIPYFGYARQDKQHLRKECVSVEVMANILKSSGVSEVLTVDIHNTEALKNLKLKIKNVSVIEHLAKQIYQELELTPQTESLFTIASPDEGGIKRSQIFAKHFYKNNDNCKIVNIKKERHLEKSHYCEAVELIGDIKNQKLILIDDVSTSGLTLLNALELCKANGSPEVYALIIHPDFAQGVAEKFQNSDFKKVYTTNSIERTVDNLYFYNKIRVFDISKVLSKQV